MSQPTAESAIASWFEQQHVVQHSLDQLLRHSQETVGDSGLTVAQLAIRAGSSEYLRKLLDCGVDVLQPEEGSPDPSCWPDLATWPTNPVQQTARTLVALGHALVQTPGSETYVAECLLLAVRKAVERGCVLLAPYLLTDTRAEMKTSGRFRVPPENDLSQTDLLFGQLARNTAGSYAHLLPLYRQDVAELVIQHGKAALLSPGSAHPHGTVPPVFQAVAKGDVASLTWMFETFNLTVDEMASSRDQQGMSLCQLAIRCKQGETLHYLLSLGVDMGGRVSSTQPHDVTSLQAALVLAMKGRRPFNHPFCADLKPDLGPDNHESVAAGGSTDKQDLYYTSLTYSASLIISVAESLTGYKAFSPVVGLALSWLSNPRTLESANDEPPEHEDRRISRFFVKHTEVESYTCPTREASCCLCRPSRQLLDRCTWLEGLAIVAHKSTSLETAESFQALRSASLAYPKALRATLEFTKNGNAAQPRLSANLTATDTSLPPLHRRILEAKVDVSRVKDELTSMTDTARRNALNERNRFGLTACHLAVRANNPELLLELMKRGADLLKPEPSYVTVLEPWGKNDSGCCFEEKAARSTSALASTMIAAHVSRRAVWKAVVAAVRACSTRKGRLPLALYYFVEELKNLPLNPVANLSWLRVSREPALSSDANQTSAAYFAATGNLVRLKDTVATCGLSCLLKGEPTMPYSMPAVVAAAAYDRDDILEYVTSMVGLERLLLATDTQGRSAWHAAVEYRQCNAVLWLWERMDQRYALSMPRVPPGHTDASAIQHQSMAWMQEVRLALALATCRKGGTEPGQQSVKHLRCLRTEMALPSLMEPPQPCCAHASRASFQLVTYSHDHSAARAITGASAGRQPLRQSSRCVAMQCPSLLHGLTAAWLKPPRPVSHSRSDGLQMPCTDVCMYPLVQWLCREWCTLTGSVEAGDEGMIKHIPSLLKAPVYIYGSCRRTTPQEPAAYVPCYVDGHYSKGQRRPTCTCMDADDTWEATRCGEFPVPSGQAACSFVFAPEAQQHAVHFIKKDRSWWMYQEAKETT